MTYTVRHHDKVISIVFDQGIELKVGDTVVVDWSEHGFPRSIRVVSKTERDYLSLKPYIERLRAHPRFRKVIGLFRRGRGVSETIG